MFSLFLIQLDYIDFVMNKLLKITNQNNVDLSINIFFLIKILVYQNQI